MNKRSLRVVDVLIVAILAIGVLSLFIPVYTATNGGREGIVCMNNLKQIGTLVELYRKSFGGENHEFPHETGRAWHLVLVEKVAENGLSTVFQCPLEGDSKTFPDFRGPSKDLNVTENYSMTDPIAGDEFENHGDPARHGVSVLTEGYQVLKITKLDSVRWSKFEADTSD